MLIDRIKRYRWTWEWRADGSLRTFQWLWWIIGYKELCPMCETWHWYRKAGNVCTKCERKFSSSNAKGETSNEG